VTEDISSHYNDAVVSFYYERNFFHSLTPTAVCNVNRCCGEFYLLVDGRSVLTNDLQA
jgi:hypothetical protein